MTEEAPAIVTPAATWERWQLLNPCEYGPTTLCVWGRHAGCGAHVVWSPSAYLTRRDRTVVAHRGQDVVLLPMHRWSCSCACHTDAIVTAGYAAEDVQLGLFGVGT